MPQHSTLTSGSPPCLCEPPEATSCVVLNALVAEAEADDRREERVAADRSWMRRIDIVECVCCCFDEQCRWLVLVICMGVLSILDAGCWMGEREPKCRSSHSLG